MSNSWALILLSVLALVSWGLSFWCLRNDRRLKQQLLRFLEAMASSNVFQRGDVKIEVQGLDLLRELEDLSLKVRSRLGSQLLEKEQSTAVFGLLEEALLVMDARGRVCAFNPAAVKILSLSPKVTLPASPQECIRDLQAREFFEAFLRSPQTFLETELSIQGDRKVHVTVKSQSGEQGDFVGALAVLRDVSKVRLLEKHRREFVSNVSHEMKTPLTLIKGSVETLDEDRQKFSDEHRYLLDLIKHNTDNLVESIEALLILSRLDEAGYHCPMESLSIKEFLDKTFREFEERAKSRGVALKLEKFEEQAVIEASGPLLSKALGNLLDNAIKHNDPGTKVEFGVNLKGDRVVFFVKDNGRGVPEEELPRIFERFYRSKSHAIHQGSGLGLALVKNIAKAHRGEVRVDSRLGESSEFCLDLPLR